MKFSPIQGTVFLVLLTLSTPLAGQGFDPRTATEQLSRWITEDLARQRARARAREDAEDQALQDLPDFSQFATPAETLSSPEITVQARAETIDVKYYGKLDLAPFACTEISRSSFINRACYDKAKRFMVVQLKTVYYPYCEMPSATYDAFLSAPSMGKYYNTNIKGTGQDGPFDCRTHPVPKY